MFFDKRGSGIQKVMMIMVVTMMMTMMMKMLMVMMMIITIMVMMLMVLAMMMMVLMMMQWSADDRFWQFCSWNLNNGIQLCSLAANMQIRGTNILFKCEKPPTSRYLRRKQKLRLLPPNKSYIIQRSMHQTCKWNLGMNQMTDIDRYPRTRTKQYLKFEKWEQIH